MACGLMGEPPPRHVHRRGAKEELVDLVQRAIFGQFLDVEYLAHCDANGGDHDQAAIA